MAEIDIYGLLHGMPTNCVPGYVQALQDKILEIERKKQELLAEMPPVAGSGSGSTTDSASGNFIVALSRFAQGHGSVPSIKVLSYVLEALTVRRPYHNLSSQLPPSCWSLSPRFL